MLGLKLNRVSKRGPRWSYRQHIGIESSTGQGVLVIQFSEEYVR